MMQKMNNKGFLLAESLITATFVLTVLIYLFSQFKNLMVEYKKNYQYNNVQDIYNLGSISKYINHNVISLTKEELYNGDTSFSEYYFLDEMVTKMNIDYIIYTDSDLEKVNMSGYSQDLQDFIEKISRNKIVGKGRLIAKFKNGNFATIVTEVLE